MIHHLRAQLDAFRLGVHQRDLRRREQDALARLGKMTLGEGGTRVGRLALLATEAAAARSRLEALSGQRQPPGAANRADLQRRRESLEQKLRELHLIAGRLVMAMPATEAGTEVLAIRAELRTPRASAIGSTPKGGGSARNSWPGPGPGLPPGRQRSRRWRSAGGSRAAIPSRTSARS